MSGYAEYFNHIIKRKAWQEQSSCGIVNQSRFQLCPMADLAGHR